MNFQMMVSRLAGGGVHYVVLLAGRRVWEEIDYNPTAEFESQLRQAGWDRFADALRHAIQEAADQ